MSEDSARPIGVAPGFQCLFDSAFRGHRIHALPPKGGTRVWDAPPDTTQWIEAARTWMDHQKGCKFYFSPATIKPGNQTTTKADMLSSEWVWADLDPRKGEPLDAERTEMLALLTTDLPIDVARPTFVVDSGRGFWAFWRLRAPHVFDGRDGDATRTFEAVLRGLANAFGEFGDRSVKNINRIARLPSSINPKTGAVAEVIAFNKVGYKLTDFPVITIQRKARAEGGADAVPLNIFKKMLRATPYTGGPDGLDDRHGQDGWLTFAMAVHEAARGDCADYLDAFVEWCHNDPNAKDEWTAESIQARWESFDCDGTGGVTRGSWEKLLLHFAQDDLVSDATQDTTAYDDFAGDEPPQIPPPTSKSEAKGRAKAERAARERERLRAAKHRNAMIRKVRAMLEKTVANGCTEEEAASAQAKAAELIGQYRLTAEELLADIADEADVGTGGDVGGDFTDIPTGSSPKDFYCHLPTNTFIYRATHDMWPPGTINGRFGKGAATKLQRNRGVEQATWAPGYPPLIRDKLIPNGAWVSEPGASCFNLYRPPLPNKAGDKDKAGPWLDHLKKEFPDDWEHIRNWFAYRVQHPEVKINHCIVMGGDPGTGKDTLIAGVREAIGAWNFQECNPPQLFEAFDASFLQSVILRINEARDMGESKIDRYQFYERTKTLMASPPETLTVQEKYLKRYSIMNLVCIIITTNNKTNGLYLKGDDRRHFVAWSPLTETDFEAGYFTKLWDWYNNEDGFGHVAAYLREVDVTAFDPKASPPKTSAFWEIVGANQAPEDSELSSLLTMIGDPFEQPDAVTVEQVAAMAYRHLAEFGEFYSMITDKKSRRTMPGRFERAGYVSVRNPGDRKDGLWAVNRKRQVIYVRKELSIKAQYAAAEALIKEAERAAKLTAAKRAARPTDEVDDLADLM
jgi:hypothetical protein